MAVVAGIVHGLANNSPEMALRQTGELRAVLDDADCPPHNEVPDDVYEDGQRLKHLNSFLASTLRALVAARAGQHLLSHCCNPCLTKRHPSNMTCDNPMRVW